MEGRFSEIDVSETGAKDKMRSAPVLDKARLEQAFKTVPLDIEGALKEVVDLEDSTEELN